MINDMSYCATFCDQADCERNLRFNKPAQKFYSVTTFDDSKPEINRYNVGCMLYDYKPVTLKEILGGK